MLTKIFLDNGAGQKLSEDLKNHISHIKMIPCSSSESARGFNFINFKIIDTRSRLLIKHGSNLVFIKLNEIIL